MKMKSKERIKSCVAKIIPLSKNLKKYYCDFFIFIFYLRTLFFFLHKSKSKSGLHCSFGFRQKFNSQQELVQKMNKKRKIKSKCTLYPFAVSQYIIVRYCPSNSFFLSGKNMFFFVICLSPFIMDTTQTILPNDTIKYYYIYSLARLIFYREKNNKCIDPCNSAPVHCSTIFPSKKATSHLHPNKPFFQGEK